MWHVTELNSAAEVTHHVISASFSSRHTTVRYGWDVPNPGNRIHSYSLFLEHDNKFSVTQTPTSFRYSY
jgi:hypothetical protein